MKTLSLSFFLFLGLLSYGQSSFVDNTYGILDQVGYISLPLSEKEFTPVEIEIEEEVPFVNFVLVIESDNDRLQNYWIRWSDDGIDWSDYHHVNIDSHADDIYEHTISELIYAEKDTRFFQIKYINETANVISISKSKIWCSAPLMMRSGSSDAISSGYRDECLQPKIMSRSDWCSSGECPIGDGVETDVTHLIVHHSAGVSESNDWAAVVRSIWHYHVDTRGWDDVGYNWLIDANGVIYEGRPDNIRGAHMCGKNTGTMGVCVLGNFETAQPTEAAIIALDSLLAWKVGQKKLDPTNSSIHSSSGINLNTIAGHKDGCNPGYTLCPGVNLYPKLSSIRTSVSEIVKDCDEEEEIIVVPVIEIPSLLNNLIDDRLYISTSTFNYNFKIVNVLGQIVVSTKGVKYNVIDVSSLASGCYFLSIEQVGKEHVFKFVKKG